MILVIAHEDAGAADAFASALDPNPEPDHRQVTQHVQPAQDHCGPFREPRSPPFPLALEYQMRINPDRGIVDEHLAIHLAQVDRARHSGCNHCNSPLHGDGYTEILGEVIQRAEREDPERDSASGENTRDGPNAAVAAANHDGMKPPI